ncbi:hypothetical protein ASPZODRAFT_130276 [Penicilliopsis zonata CBS 506.65]|uniref:Nephrocystin 3-like N-terminal domain-containing protein n=1 Tax=Penicilliopsis zonata CBS 506.65 TaxID=1073090 RepID=A0A1L9SM28_9EURO|nr:hypothetical protein ASPZODRAFT_130276 [Penicilliopsis zonata CBS 506.65]OJJ48299.1 hypothetical protein ASPZODRAFT_130276 [Penicilliopsis zonata CBS 506.65]
MNPTKWGDRLQEIQAAEKQVEKYIQYDQKTQILHNLRQARETGSSLLAVVNKHYEYIEQHDQAEERSKFIQLFTPNPTQHNFEAYREYLDKIKTPLETTNSGVRSHPKFKKWQSGEQNLLLLAANPGAGKSVLLKSVLDELEGESDAVCSFFFKLNMGNQHKANIALCKILSELFRAREDLIAGVQDMVKTIDTEDMRFNISRLCEILKQATATVAPGSVTVLLDALDEVDTDQLEALLDQIRHFSDSPVRFLFTSRPIQRVLENFPQSELVLNVNEDTSCSESLSADIAKVAEDQLQHFFQEKKIRDKSLQSKLRDQVQDRVYANRTYLFVGLLYDYLNRQTPRIQLRSWLKVFQSLPSTAFETYRAFLDRIDEEDRPVVKTMLQILLAAQRPLTVTEMNIALEIKDSEEITSTEDLYVQDSKEYEALIHETCHFFLVIYDNRVHFIHQTVEDYLRPRQADDKRPDWLVEDLTDVKCHQTLMDICTRYISSPLLEGPAIDSLEDFLDAPMFTQAEYYHQYAMDPPGIKDYAVRQWLVHLDAIRQGENKEWSEVLDQVRQEYGQEFLAKAELAFCCSSLPAVKEIEVYRRTPVFSSPNRDDALSCLIPSLGLQYLRTGLHQGLTYAIELGQEVQLSGCSQDDSRRAQRLIDLSRTYVMRGLIDRRKEDIECSLDLSEQAIRITSPDHVNRSRALEARAAALGQGFILRFWGEEKINQAIEDIEMALNPVEHTITEQDSKYFSHTRAVILGNRYQSPNKHVGDLDEAIKSAQRAVDMISDMNPLRVVALRSLAILLGLHASETREKDHIARAIAIDRQALGKDRSQDSSLDRAGMLNVFARHLKLQYETSDTKDPAVLEEALHAARSSARLAQKTHVSYKYYHSAYQALRQLAKSEGLSLKDYPGDSESDSTI